MNRRGLLQGLLAAPLAARVSLAAPIEPVRRIDFPTGLVLIVTGGFFTEQTLERIEREGYVPGAVYTIERAADNEYVNFVIVEPNDRATTYAQRSDVSVGSQIEIAV